MFYRCMHVSPVTVLAETREELKLGHDDEENGNQLEDVKLIQKKIDALSLIHI